MINKQEKGNSSIPICTVQQLARFINDKTHKSISNYSILIGSGCSVTSNIRSGEQLIKEWQGQIYSESTDDYDLDGAEKRIENHHFIIIPIKEIILGPKFENAAMKIPFLQEQLDRMSEITNSKTIKISLSNIDYRQFETYYSQTCDGRNDNNSIRRHK